MATRETMPQVINELTRRMVDPSGFDEVFYWTAGNTNMTHKQVFNALNLLYEVTYGIEKYSSYDSYRRTRRRRIKK